MTHWGRKGPKHRAGQPAEATGGEDTGEAVAPAGEEGAAGKEMIYGAAKGKKEKPPGQGCGPVKRGAGQVGGQGQAPSDPGLGPSRES